MGRIAFMVKTFEGGGAQRVIHTLTRYFVSLGMEIHIFTMYHAESYCMFPGVFMWNMDIDRADTSVAHNRQKIMAAATHAKELRMEAVIVCSTSAPMYEYALEMCEYTPLKILAVMTNAPERSPVSLEARARRDGVFNTLLEAGAGFLFQNAYERDYFPQSIRDRSILADNPLMEGLPSAYIGKREPIIVSAGRFDEQKNFELLIRAFAKFHRFNPNYRLHIYGRGHMQPVYQKEIHACTMTGYVQLLPFAIDIHTRIRSAAAFVQSSDYEGVSNMLLEAIALGLPVISTDCPAYGARDFIESGRHGLLTPMGDEDSLAEAMRMVTSSDSYAAQARIAAEQIRKRLDTAAIGRQYLEFLDDLSPCSLWHCNRG